MKKMILTVLALGALTSALNIGIAKSNSLKMKKFTPIMRECGIHQDDGC